MCAGMNCDNNRKRCLRDAWKCSGICAWKVKREMIYGGVVVVWRGGNGQVDSSWKSPRRENMFWRAELPTQRQPIIMMMFVFLTRCFHWEPCSGSTCLLVYFKTWLAYSIYFEHIFDTVMAYAISLLRLLLEKYCQHRYLHWNLLQIEKEYRWRLRAKVST